ncbi:GNVR domain-containing protein [Pelagicoccus sp. SDUM812005]|uniref:GumC family protein n=1 Tax=Pelagicoccus sp. SDUM812005 TaxID=3041257 RepID=UPI00280DD4A8|nr:GNVR domain-containing protein [Pelagicoccus sp. SDUM812005]MDQ8183718.1 GNVR domain-containing protein [Pelagicoccus sp. SDUM812005]
MNNTTPFNAQSASLIQPKVQSSSPSSDIDVAKHLAAFRDRIWLFLLIAIVAAAAIYYFVSSSQPLYEAHSVVQILREEESRTDFNKVSDETIRSTEDINTQVRLLSSLKIVDAVARRIEESFKAEFIKPYLEIDQQGDDLSLISILAENRKITPARLSLIVSVSYTHPSPEIAARVANLFSEEMATYYTTLRSEVVTRAVQDLREQAEIQRRKVENIEKQLVDYKEDLKTISFDQRLDIDQQEMVALKTFSTQKAEQYDRLKSQWQMLQSKREAGEKLESLSFIANSARVSTLMNSLAERKIDVARLSERYRHRHPRMIEGQEALKAVQSELDRATESEANLLLNQLTLAERDLQKAQANVDSKKQEIIGMQRHKALYDSKARELAVNQNLYQYLYNRIQETEAQKRDDIDKIRIIDPASLPLVPSSPNKKMGALAAVAGGGFIAFALVFALVMSDDHVKTHKDVEKKLGLPILGMLGLIKGSPQTIHDLALGTATDPQNSEMLNSIVASLRLSPESAHAKTILVTSTISNEGKSYISSIIASTFQRFGERSIIINCDLRAREDRLQLLTGQGLLPYLEDDSKTLDESIYHSKDLDCDVMPAGGYHDQPYRLYSSERFREMLSELRKKYDRIIIDTPPSHLFGDSLSLLSMCEGQIFVSGFARVRMSIAVKTVKRLKNTRCPIFGAIINGVKTHQAKAYYPAHYAASKTYSGYESARVRPARV